METVKTLESMGAEVIGAACVADRRAADCDFPCGLRGLKLTIDSYARRTAHCARETSREKPAAAKCPQNNPNAKTGLQTEAAQLFKALWNRTGRGHSVAPSQPAPRTVRSFFLARRGFAVNRPYRPRYRSPYRSSVQIGTAEQGRKLHSRWQPSMFALPPRNRKLCGRTAHNQKRGRRGAFPPFRH